MRLSIPSLKDRAKALRAKWRAARKKWIAWAWVDDYPFKRKVFNAQRRHQHPAMMRPSRRRKLRST